MIYFIFLHYSDFMTYNRQKLMMGNNFGNRCTITVFSLHPTLAQQIHQPIHPSMIPRLDPEYVDFHNKFIATIVPPHTLPWDPAMRNGPAVPGGSHPLPVGKTEDIDMTHTGFRAFTPEGISPANGWPCFIFFH